MARPYIIPLEYFPNNQQKISVEQRVEVPHGSSIFWAIYVDEKLRRFRGDLRFLFFFPNRTPFFKPLNKRVPLDKYNRLPRKPIKEIRSEFNGETIFVEGGEARISGSYKYDINISTAEGEPIYDEDPYIIVLPKSNTPVSTFGETGNPFGFDRFITR